MPRGKTKKSLELIQASKEILAEIHPASVRAVCYQLLNARLIPTMAKKHTSRVSVQLVYAREQGLIPWGWIVDETRAPERTPQWENPEEFKQAAKEQYRRDRWPSQPCLVEVWSEKGTVRGTLAPVLKAYGVTFRVMHGYGSATEVHQVAVGRNRDNGPLVILYVGDWDPSGMHMSAADLPARLQEYGAYDVDLMRVALNAKDVRRGTLPALDANPRDPRFKWYRKRFNTEKCWELDALNPTTLRKRVENQIRRRIDWESWERVGLVEKAEQVSLGRVLDAWSDAISRQGPK